jgi:hypothetical protein
LSDDEPVRSNAMARTEPEPTLMTKFCCEVVPAMLHDVCQVEAAEAKAVGAEILARANAFAALDQHSQDVITSPFVEEVFDHEPADAPLTLTAAVAVVARNSGLEDLHSRGVVEDGGLRAITEMAAAPLSHLLAARRRQSEPAPSESGSTHLTGVVL